jgi:hypothetical protein
MSRTRFQRRLSRPRIYSGLGDKADSGRFARIFYPYLKGNRRIELRLCRESCTGYSDPWALIKSRRFNAGIQRLLPLFEVGLKCLPALSESDGGRVSGTLGGIRLDNGLLRDGLRPVGLVFHPTSKVFRPVGLFTGRNRKIVSIDGLFAGCDSKGMSILRTRTHLAPLKTYKEGRYESNSSGCPGPPQSRLFIASEIVLYCVELLLGSWLGIFYAVKNFGGLDWRFTFRALSGFFIGLALFVHGGVSVTQKILTLPHVFVLQ